MPGQHGTSAIAFALALVVASASSLAAAGSLDEQCHKMLRRQVFNCACTTDFLDAQLEAEQAEIMRELWILAVNEAGQSEAVAALYRKFAPKAIDDAVMAFQGHRGRLRTFCINGGPNIAD